MEKDDLDEIVEDVTDWFTDHLDIDVDCLKISAEVNEEATEVTIVVSYHSMDWATKIINETITDEEEIFTNLDEEIGNSFGDSVLDDALSYETHDIEPESLFDWTITIITSILFDECDVEDLDEEAEDGEASNEGVDEYL